MSKSATIKSGGSMKQTAKPAAAQSRFTRNAKWIAGAGALVLVIGGMIIAAKPEPGASKATGVDAGKDQAAVTASRETGPAHSVGALAATQTKFSFGPISMARGKVTHRYPIRNTGAEPIFIRKMYTSCMCTTVALVKNGKTSEAYGMPGHTPIPMINVPINPREEALVEVVFDPAAHGPAGVGPIERVVTLENSAGAPLELEFAALVSP